MYFNDGLECGLPLLHQVELISDQCTCTQSQTPGTYQTWRVFGLTPHENLAIATRWQFYNLIFILTKIVSDKPRNWDPLQKRFLPDEVYVGWSLRQMKFTSLFIAGFLWWESDMIDLPTHHGMSYNMPCNQPILGQYWVNARPILSQY